MPIPEITTLEELDTFMEKVKVAQKEFATFSQEKVDKIFAAAASAANDNKLPLAIEAAEESGLGVAEDKIIKNAFASEMILNKYRDLKTCDVIEKDEVNGITKVAEPLGILAGIVPCTNPTSTAMFKALISLKTRNAIVFSPHPRTPKCIFHTIEIINDAAVAAGAPENLLGCISKPTLDLSQALMRHALVDSIIATGGPGLVNAAYTSGKPSLGVGAGNTPAVIDETAHIETAVNQLIMSKTFDNGMICASEQVAVVHQDVADAVRAEFVKRGCYILNDEEKAKVQAVMFQGEGHGYLNAGIVGQPAYKIAEMAGFTVPEATKVLIGECDHVGKDEGFTREKLSPTLGLIVAKTWQEAIDLGVQILNNGGIGHTAVYHTDLASRDRIAYFHSHIKAGRVLVQSPAAQGAIGDLYNFRLNPSLTLGTGSWGKNSVSHNVGPMDLLNVKTVAEKRENMLWFRAPSRIYFKYGCLDLALRELVDEGRTRFFIMTDKPLVELGYAARVTGPLEKLGAVCRVFDDVLPDPDLKTINAAVDQMKQFQPDCVIGLGGGSPMDAAKIARLMYEHPSFATDEGFARMNQRFMDIRKRINKFPDLTVSPKTLMACIPTTSGTGSEVTPFAVITDEKTQKKYPLADYELTPQMAIVDCALVMSMPSFLTAFTGIDALTHAVESCVSILANDYTLPLSLQAAKLIFDYLPRAVKNGANDIEAREKIHNAACIAGMAFSNAFLGLNHSMAHKLGAAYHVPHGLANSILMTHVIRYNAVDDPAKQGVFPQYRYPQAKERYAMLADYIGCTKEAMSDEEKVDALIAKIEELQKECNVPLRVRDCRGVPSEEEYMNYCKELAILAHDDQCTGANPVYPLFKHIEEIYRAIW